MNRRKMIKSTGNAGDPLFAFSELDVDAMCFYLAHEGCIANDGDYGAPTATASYKKGCEDGWGKLAGCIRRRKFDLQRAFQRTVEINPPRLPLEDLLRKTPPPVQRSPEAVLTAGILLQPFLQGEMNESLDGLGVHTDRRRFEHLVVGGDRVYGGATLNEEWKGLEDGGCGENGVLFPAAKEGYYQ